ncbi:Complement C4-A [Manis pentadactyla]|nr:Complement C4-A [Manis pentadactyla]
MKKISFGSVGETSRPGLASRGFRFSWSQPTCGRATCPVGKISATSQNKRNENAGKEAKEESHKYASGRGSRDSSKSLQRCTMNAVYRC